MSAHPTDAEREAGQRAFVQALPLLVTAADQLKLYATARVLQQAQDVAGFELAEIIEKRAAKEKANG